MLCAPILLAAGASAFHAAPMSMRPALKATRSVSMLAPDPALVSAAHGALDFIGSTLAEEAEAVEIGPVLIAQIGVIGAMIGGGTALEIWGDVDEPEEEGAEEGSVDIYRDTALRYMGYANEVGEAFRPLVPVEVVYLTYVGAITYILADTFDKGKKGAKDGDILKAVIGSTDTFCWQMLASVIYPSYCINRLVLLVVSYQATPDCPEVLQFGAIATVLGLLAIPLLIKPLDILAHQTLNLSFRKTSKEIVEAN